MKERDASRAFEGFAEALQHRQMSRGPARHDSAELETGNLGRRGAGGRRRRSRGSLEAQKGRERAARAIQTRRSRTVVAPPMPVLASPLCISVHERTRCEVWTPTAPLARHTRHHPGSASQKPAMRVIRQGCLRRPCQSCSTRRFGKPDSLGIDVSPPQARMHACRCVELSSLS